MEGAYEFDCLNDQTGERLTLEIKRLTWGEHVMRGASKQPNDPGCQEEIEFPLADLRKEAEARLKKANKQLWKASATRRCVLLVWQYELPAHLSLLRSVIGSLRRDCFPNVDEVWLTMTHLLDFHRIDLAQ